MAIEGGDLLSPERSVAPAGAAPSAPPPQLDERILFELARNPELLQIVNDYLDKKNGEAPVS